MRGLNIAPANVLFLLGRVHKKEGKKRLRPPLNKKAKKKKLKAILGLLTVDKAEEAFGVVGGILNVNKDGF